MSRNSGDISDIRSSKNVLQYLLACLGMLTMKELPYNCHSFHTICAFVIHEMRQLLSNSEDVIIVTSYTKKFIDPQAFILLIAVV